MHNLGLHGHTTHISIDYHFGNETKVFDYLIYCKRTLLSFMYPEKTQILSPCATPIFSIIHSISARAGPIQIGNTELSPRGMINHGKKGITVTVDCGDDFWDQGLAGN